MRDSKGKRSAEHSGRAAACVELSLRLIAPLNSRHQAAAQIVVLLRWLRPKRHGMLNAQGTQTAGRGKMQAVRHVWISLLLTAVAATARGEDAADSLGVLVAQLGGADLRASAHAAAKIAELRPLPRVAAPLLADRLMSFRWHDYLQRNRAIVEALGRMGPDAKAAAPPMFAWCEGQGPDEQRLVVETLRKIFPEQRSLIDAFERFPKRRPAVLLLLKHQEPEAIAGRSLLHEGLDHQSAAVRQACCRALSNQPPLPKRYEASLLRLIDDGDADVRFAAAFALRHSGPEIQRRILPALREGLGRPKTRNLAIYGLGDLGPSAVDATADLRAIVITETEESPDARYKDSAARALCRVARPEVAVPIYAKALEQGHVFPGTIYRCLGDCGSNPTAVDLLIEAASAEHHDSRRKADARVFAIHALGRIDPPSHRSIATLIEIAKGEDLKLRWAALGALKEIGGNDVHVRAALFEVMLLPDRDGQHRRLAADALVELGVDDRAVERLARLLKQDDLVLRQIAVRLLGHGGKHARATVPTLVELLDDADPLLREAAQSALADLGPVAETAVPAIADRMADHDGYWHDSPACALCRIGPAAIPALMKRLRQEGSSSAYWGADDALRMMGPRAAPAVPQLIEMLEGDDAEQRREALRLLAAIGPGAHEASERLVPLLAINDQPTRFAAARALCAIGDERGVTLHVLREMAEGDPQARLQAIRLMATVAAVDESGWVNETLLTSLQSPSDELQLAAARALVEIGGKNAEASLPVLSQFVISDERGRGGVAVELIVRLLGGDESR